MAKSSFKSCILYISTATALALILSKYFYVLMFEQDALVEPIWKKSEKVAQIYGPLVSVINSSANFFVYILGNDLYWKEFVKIVRKIRNRQKYTQSVTRRQLITGKMMITSSPNINMNSENAKTSCLAVEHISDSKRAASWAGIELLPVNAEVVLNDGKAQLPNVNISHV